MTQTTDHVQPAASNTTWDLDVAHSSAHFSVRHMMISNVRGEIRITSGVLQYDPKKPEAARVEVSLDPKTIDTRDKQRDDHLRSADFFETEKHGTLTFQSNKVSRDGAGRFTVTGTLTIRGVGKEVTLAVEGPTPPTKDPWGNMRVGVSATTKINRKDFGLTWNNVIETGGLLVGEDVAISIDAEFIQKKG